MEIVRFIIALSFLVVVHELGHFIAAKVAKVKVLEFGLGLPPTLFARRIGETKWSINALFVGGFVRLFGEDASFAEGKAAKHQNSKHRSFAYAHPLYKAMIVVGGVCMNILVAAFIFTLVYTKTGVPQETARVKVVGVAPDSPAAQAGLRPGDWLVEVDQRALASSEGLIEAVKAKGGTKVKLLVARAEEGFGLVECPKEVTKDYGCQLVEVLVREQPPKGEGAMGVAMSSVDLVKIAWPKLPFVAIKAGFAEAYAWGGVILKGLGDMITSVVGGKAPEGIAGPIGIYQASSSIAQSEGFWGWMHFLGILSVNLAVVNILPFPALDGGRLVFIGYELITKKRVAAKLELLVNNIGMGVLLAILALVTVSDIVRIIGG